MTKRVTIIVDDDVDRKTRLRQAKLIEKEQKSISYSRVINELVRKGLAKK